MALRQRGFISNGSTHSVRPREGTRACTHPQVRAATGCADSAACYLALKGEVASEARRVGLTWQLIDPTRPPSLRLAVTSPFQGGGNPAARLCPSLAFERAGRFLQTRRALEPDQERT